MLILPALPPSWSGAKFHDRVVLTGERRQQGVRMAIIDSIQRTPLRADDPTGLFIEIDCVVL